MAKSTGSVIDDLINDEFTQMIDLSKEDDSVSYWIDSGNWAINYISSKHFSGAYPQGQIIGFAGKSGVGKSMLPDIATKDPNLDKIIILDSEGGGNGKKLLEFLGAPLEKVRYKMIQTLDSYKIVTNSKGEQEIKEIKDSEIPAKLKGDNYEVHVGLIAFLKKLLYALEYNHSQERVLIIVDSLSNLKSVRKLNGGEDMGRTNKLLNDLFALDNVIKNTNATLAFAAKVYTDLNNQYNTDGIINGGEAVIYNPSLILQMSALQDNPELSDSELSEEKARRKTSLGNSLKTVRVKVKKSRFGTEGRNAWVVLDATYGLVRNSGLFQLLFDFGVIKKQGTKYSIPGIFVNEKGEDILFYKKDFLEIFGKDEKGYIDKFQIAMDEAEERIKAAKMNININDTDELPSEEDEDISTFDMLNAMEAEAETEVTVDESN